MSFTRCGVSKSGFRLLTALPILLYSALIFTLSSFPQPDFVDLGFDLSDKLLHLAEYFVFGIFSIIALNGYRPDMAKYKAVLLIVFIGFLYGLSDEAHQYFVPGRVADIGDLAADTAGVLLSLITIKYIGNFLLRYRPA